MKLTLTLTLTTLILTTTALPSHFNVRSCTPSDGVALDGNQFWADNCDLGAGEDGFGQKLKRAAADALFFFAAAAKRDASPNPPPGPGHWDGHHDDGHQQQQQNGNNNNDGHDANWNGVYEQTPGCTPSADGVALDGNQFWADNCDLGAGGP